MIDDDGPASGEPTQHEHAVVSSGRDVDEVLGFAADAHDYRACPVAVAVAAAAAAAAPVPPPPAMLQYPVRGGFVRADDRPGSARIRIVPQQELVDREPLDDGQSGAAQVEPRHPRSRVRGGGGGCTTGGEESTTGGFGGGRRRRRWPSRRSPQGGKIISSTSSSSCFRGRRRRRWGWWWEMILRSSGRR